LNLGGGLGTRVAALGKATGRMHVALFFHGARIVR